MRRARPALTIALMASAALTLTGCAGDFRSASPSVSQTPEASSSPSLVKESYSSETTPVTASPTPLVHGVKLPETTDDFEADMERYWPGWAGSRPHLAQAIIDDVCESSMENGLESFISLDEAIALSDFDHQARSYGTRGTEQWMIPQVIVHHQCPERTKQVQVLMKFHAVQQAERETGASESANG